MTVTLILITTLMALFVGWLVRQSINMQPWRASSANETLLELPPRAINARRLGLGVLAAAIASLFALFLSAYAMRMHYPDWVSLPKPGMLWLNSGVLLLGSMALQFASNAAARSNESGTRFGLIAGLLLSIAFIIGQWLVWQNLQATGHYLAANPANSFFYVITVLHVLHVIGGLVALCRPMLWVWRRTKLAGIRSSIELCAWYWHILLVIWMVLFAVLLAT